MLRSQASRVYQQRLSELGYGTPLWRPEPSPSEVMFGDVGRIDPLSGSWDRFFNILHPAGDQFNIGGVPIGFQPLIVDVFHEHRLDGQLQPGVYSNEEIRCSHFELAGNVP